MKKKEIGKLLELLNEYHHFNSDLIGYFYDEEYEKFYFRTELPEEDKEKLRKADALIDDGINEVRVENERICSKRFGFIKWLVDNDKIDLDKVEEKSDLIEYLIGTPTKVYENIIMILAIQDEPIRFLCEIIK